MLAGVDWRPDWFWVDPLALALVVFRLLLLRELEREDFADFTRSASAVAWSSSGGIGTHFVFLGVCDTFSFSLSCCSSVVVPLADSRTLPTSGQLFVSTPLVVVLSRDGTVFCCCCC